MLTWPSYPDRVSGHGDDPDGLVGDDPDGLVGATDPGRTGTGGFDPGVPGDLTGITILLTSNGVSP